MKTARKLVAAALCIAMIITSGAALLADNRSGEENWIDASGNTARPRNSRDVRNNTNGFDTNNFTPIMFEGEVTLYAQNYGFSNDNNYDIKLYIRNEAGRHVQIGRLYGYGDALRVEVFTGHAITLVWQRHQIENRFYVVELTGPFSTTYRKDFRGENTGYTSGNIYIRYGVSGVRPPVGEAPPAVPPRDPIPPAGPGAQPSPWAAAEVNAAIAANLVPRALRANYTQPITRAEFAALAVGLYEALQGEIIGRSAFVDTDDVNVQKAAAIGLMHGVGNNRFNPDGQLTREQAAVTLSRLFDAVGQPLPRQAATFADVESIAEWARDAVGHVQAAGIMGGVGNNRFAPGDPYTREQSIVTIMRIYEIQAPANQGRPPSDNQASNQDRPSGQAEFISRDEALEIALRHAGVSREDIRDLEIELERDGGRVYFEIEFYVGRREFEYEIDARTGRILDYEWD